MNTRKSITIGTLLLLAAPAMVMAHPGHGTTGWEHGLLHPLTGLDHVLAMLAVGLLAAQMGGRARWALPLSFVSAMVLGGALGMAGVGLPYVEPAILASVVILGVMVAAAFALPLGAVTTVVGVMAIFHGHAHGSEMPETASGLVYGVGFVATTALLHAAGLGAGLLAVRVSSRVWLRYAGLAVAFGGVYLALA
ncbi:MAG: HupE/UreJ family protein [Planctomycetes bacterium]|nr:HupE/UreJ family protein [Planctomycetota bacterium]